MGTSLCFITDTHVTRVPLYIAKYIIKIILKKSPAWGLVVQIFLATILCYNQTEGTSIVEVWERCPDARPWARCPGAWHGPGGLGNNKCHPPAGGGCVSRRLCPAVGSITQTTASPGRGSTGAGRRQLIRNHLDREDSAVLPLTAPETPWAVSLLSMITEHH